MDDLLHFSPNPITFEYTPTRQTTTVLNLRNTSKHLLAYKMMTNNVKRYCVRPNRAIIAPYAELDVKLTQQALREEAHNIKHCQDRFILKVARVDLVPAGKGVGKLHGYESCSDLWKAIPKEIVRKVSVGVFLKEDKPT